MREILASITLHSSDGPSIILDDNPLVKKFLKSKNFTITFIVIEVNLEEGHGLFSLKISHLIYFKGGEI